MSQADAKSFLERAATSETFHRDLLSELQAGTDDRSPERLIQLGARCGLSFTESELAAALADSQKTSRDELSDAELETVSGGYLPMARPWDELMSALSNLLRKTSETSSTITRNIK